jgi:hypothetical protein
VDATNARGSTTHYTNIGSCLLNSIHVWLSIAKLIQCRGSLLSAFTWKTSPTGRKDVLLQILAHHPKGQGRDFWESIGDTMAVQRNNSSLMGKGDYQGHLRYSCFSMGGIY